MQKISILVCLFCSVSVMAQWSCPSKLNAHLKPLWNDSPLSWSMELESGGGILGDRFINNEMGFAALELYFKNFTVYAEGGAKYWSLWENDLQLDKFRLGMRELYVNPSFGKNDIKIGLQSLQFQDMFVFNERAMAVSFNRKANGLQIEAALGTVSKQFARNGSFCSKCFQYDIVKDRTQTHLAGNPFEEKFAALVFTVDPNVLKSTKKLKTTTNEFASFDEFKANDEFSSSNEFSNDEFGAIEAKDEKTPLVKYGKYGFLAYSEFGEFYPDAGLWTGFFSTVILPGDISFKGEYLYQYFGSNQGVISINTVEKTFAGKLGFTDLNASFYGFWGFDKQASANLAYTNLFLGEVLRMDAVDMPLLSVYAKHRFKGKGMSVKVQYATNFHTNQLSEYNLQFNKNVGEHFHFIATAGYVKASQLSDNPFLGRAEIRFTF